MMQLFANHLEGEFLSRPNRYIVTVATGGGVVEAHCANPGRLTEILFPHTPLILEHVSRSDSNRKTEWTAVAAVHNGHVVPLAAHRANRVAANLVLPPLFPNATEVRAEQPLGEGRVDFAVESPDGRTFVEVKSCTLVEHRVAMFPDSPSERATRHVEGLVRATAGPPAGEPADRGVVLFVITHGDPDVFCPNVHTDPAFASALEHAVTHSHGRVTARAVHVACDRSGEARLVSADVPVDLRPVDLVAHDGGGYLLIVRMETKATVQFGLHASADLRGGYYVYVGSAMRGITARLMRHRRKRKKHHWHIDDLLAAGSLVAALPVLTHASIEHELAAEIGAMADGSVPGFGATDSPHDSHLFYFRDDPTSRREFVDVLFRHRHLDPFRSPAET